MVAKYDIFKKINESLVWVEAVEDIVTAKKRLHQPRIGWPLSNLGFYGAAVYRRARGLRLAELGLPSLTNPQQQSPRTNERRDFHRCS